MKILITGGAGFIGGHLAKNLANEGHELTLIDNFSRGVSDQFMQDLVSNCNTEIFNIDLAKEKLINRLEKEYDYIYHFSAIIGVNHVLRNPFEVLVKNISMLDNMLEFARNQKNLRRFLFASTSEVYAGTLIDGNLEIPTPEDSKIIIPSFLEPRTSYMFSKLYGELMCNFSGVPITNVRLHNIYGPRMGMSHVIPELIFRFWSAKSGETVPVFSPQHTRTFCFIDDAIQMIRGVTENDDGLNKTINIGNMKPEISIMELAEIIREVVSRKIKLADGGVTEGSPRRRCPNTNLLASIVDNTHSVSIMNGVEKTFYWYKDNVFNSINPAAK